MATTLQRVAGSFATVLSTELNSLGNNASAISGAGYANASNYPWAEVEGTFTFGVAPGANTGISLWFVTDVDGTDYEDGSGSVVPARAPDAVIPLRAVTTAQRCTIRDVPIPPGTFFAVAQNNGTGQAMAASGNTIKILPTSYQNV